MSNTRQSVKQAVKNYYAERSLSDAQLQTLQQALNEVETQNSIKRYGRSRSNVIKWASSLVASILLVMLALVYVQTPTVVTAAYADLSKDSGLSNGLQSSMQQWLGENGLGSVPQQYAVEMSKFCRLEQYLTTHIGIAGVEQGKLHLFFHQGERPVYWVNRTGVLQNMNWKLLKVGNDLTLIVMYTQDMRETAVEQILAEILPSLQA